LWLLGEMIGMKVPEVDTLFGMLLRQINGGDISQKNLSLIHSVLSITTLHRKWVESNPILVSLLVYTFLRLITVSISTLLFNISISTH
jgi:integrator complex subunit 3